MMTEISHVKRFLTKRNCNDYIVLEIFILQCRSINHLFFKLIVHIIDDYIIFHLQDFSNFLGDPWLQNIQLHLGHVHLKKKYITK